MRLFTGIALPPDVVDNLSAAIEKLRPTAHISWSRPENLHITSRFIGEWPEDRLSALSGALSSVAVAGPIPIHISRFGFFPNPRHPHSFFADVQAGTGLANLAAAINEALLPLGLTPEPRPYRPHVTLARVKKNADFRGLPEEAATTDFEFGVFDAWGFHLFVSKPAARGSVYLKLATYDLMRETEIT